MNRRLLPCVSCSRHVRVSDAVCPFCATDLSTTVRSGAMPRSPATRLSRAALYAFGASAAAVVACGGTTSGTVSDGGADASSEEPNSRAVYGAPADPIDAGQDVSNLVDAAYGGPPRDAADEADTSFGALYGAPPP